MSCDILIVKNEEIYDIFIKEFGDATESHLKKNKSDANSVIKRFIDKHGINEISRHGNGANDFNDLFENSIPIIR